MPIDPVTGRLIPVLRIDLLREIIQGRTHLTLTKEHVQRLQDLERRGA